MNFVREQSDDRPAIHFDKLVKTFGNTRAVNEVTFEVYPGEVFGLSLIHI